MTFTYNPLTKEEISKFDVSGNNLIADPNTTLVLSGKGRELLVLKQGDRSLTMSETMWGVYNTVYKVDISEKSLQFKCNLPCKTDAFFFYANIQFNCSVIDAELIVKKNITDVLRYLEPILTEIMRNKSRDYTVDQSGVAEKEISIEIKKEIVDSGFELRNMTLQLSLSEDAAKYIRELLAIKRQQEIDLAKQQKDAQEKDFIRSQEEADFLIRQERTKNEHDLQMKIELEQAKNNAELNTISFQSEQQRKKQESNDEIDLEIERARKEIELEQLKAQRRMIEQRGNLDLSIMAQAHEETKLAYQLRMMESKVAFYLPMVKEGNWELLALTLAQAPEDIHFVVGEISKRKENERIAWINAVEMFIENGALESQHLEPIAMQVLQGLYAAMKQSALGLTADSSAGSLPESKPEYGASKKIDAPIEAKVENSPKEEPEFPKPKNDNPV